MLKKPAMEKPDFNVNIAKNKRANWLNLAIMLAAIILALVVYYWRRPKAVTKPVVPVKTTAFLLQSVPCN
jgi:archaellum biogenesis protein FlaJ (TadC family)